MPAPAVLGASVNPGGGRRTISRYVDSSSSGAVPLLVAHGDAMRRLARALVYDEHLSEDVAQEAARVALGRDAPAGWPAWAWLSGIVRNVARNALRGERRRHARESALSVSDRQVAETPLERVARIEAQRRVVDAVLRLDEPYRAVVIGRYFDGASVEELAARLATPRETVKTRLRRAIERLRGDLDATRSPTAPDWRTAFLPVLAPGPRPRPPPASSPVPALVEGIVMKKTLSVVLAVLLGAIGWMGWRLTALSADVERLSRRPEPIALPRSRGARQRPGSRRRAR